MNMINIDDDDDNDDDDDDDDDEWPEDSLDCPGPRPTEIWLSVWCCIEI